MLIEHGLTVFTANTKHYAPIDGLRTDAFVP